MFEAIGFTLAQLELWLLVFVRFLTLLSVLPFFSYTSIDARMRVFLAIAMASIMVKLIPYPANFPVEFTMLMFLVAKEVFLGLCIGMFAGFFVEIIKFAGQQASAMVGLTMSTVIDPTTSEQTEAMPELFHIIAILLILAINGHHFFVRVMFDTFFLIPVTEMFYDHQVVPQMVNIVSNIFVLGIRIAAPIVILVFFVRIVVGIMNRLVQEADVFSVLLIINIIIGFYILMYYWPYFAQMVNMVFNVTQNQVLVVLRLLSPNF
ncbi:MAG: flagellar biosynthetic protein FliR [Candidatus Cloacimonetes bacterium]|nr:flagellar biosynthetic protein FliR [Candidatus Cloacimonadota bacterium]